MQQENSQAVSQHGLFDPNLLYEFEPVSAPGKVLDVSMNPKEGEKLKMILYRRNHGLNQRFKIVEISPGKYQIFSTIPKDTYDALPEGGNFTVQVPKESTKSGEQVLANQVDNQTNELWEIILASNGIYTVKSFNGLALDVKASSTKNETPIIQFPFHGHKNQQWIIRPKKDYEAPRQGQFDPSKLYEFESVLAPGMLLNASLNPKQKLKMILFQRSIATNERFKILEVSPGKYQIITTIQSKEYSLQVPKASDKESQQLQVNQINSKPHQLWEIIALSNGIYMIAAYNGFVIDVYENFTKNETPIIQYGRHRTKNQQWIIRSVN